MRAARESEVPSVFSSLLFVRNRESGIEKASGRFCVREAFRFFTTSCVLRFPILDSRRLVCDLRHSSLADPCEAKGCMSQSTVLVVAKDRVIAALLGALIELSGRRVAFRSDNEGIDSAVRRAAAELVLFDCALGISTCAEIAATARLEGARLLMFSASHTERDARDLASLYGAQCFVLPVKPREFMDRVDRALGTMIAT